MKEHMTDAAIAAAAQKWTVGGGLSAVVGGVTANQIAAIGGLVVAILGVMVQVYFKHRDDKRKAEAHKIWMQGKLLRPYEDDSDG